MSSAADPTAAPTAVSTVSNVAISRKIHLPLILSLVLLAIGSVVRPGILLSKETEVLSTCEKFYVSAANNATVSNTSNGANSAAIAVDEPHPSGQSAAVCLEVKDIEKYLDEWVDYYFGMGFSGIYIYDNSDHHNMKGWKPSRRLEKHQTVKVTHFPGAAVQRKVYGACAAAIQKTTNFTWVAFYDVDEFLVLRKHDHIVDLLQEHCSEGSLSINWLMVGSGNQTFYRPLPVSKRFQYRHRAPNKHVKTIVKLSDLDLPFKRSAHQIHNFKLKKGKTQKDTNGTVFQGPYNVNGPTDVASIYHFFTKSESEFYDKACVIGQPNGKQSHCGKKPYVGDVLDESVWVQMKKHNPQYAWFDQLYTPSLNV